MPEHYVVEREQRIHASPAAVQERIVDFRRWQAWSPWEDLDPALRREYSGADSGVGARYAWEGNRKAGKGNMEIVDSTPERVELRLSFEKPWKATNRVVFELVPEGDRTGVTWRMSGKNKGVAALFTRIIGMDRMLGKDFEKGLARMKGAAESG
jgi:Polyketide cyclase / dehydrase and lipid transport